MMKYWIIPCNVKDYDVIGAFNKLSEIDWKQSNNMKTVGDMVLIYLSVPIHVLNIYVKLKK